MQEGNGLSWERASTKRGTKQEKGYRSDKACFKVQGDSYTVVDSLTWLILERCPPKPRSMSKIFSEVNLLTWTSWMDVWYCDCSKARLLELDITWWATIAWVRKIHLRLRLSLKFGEHYSFKHCKTIFLNYCNSPCDWNFLSLRYKFGFAGCRSKRNSNRKNEATTCSTIE